MAQTTDMNTRTAIRLREITAEVEWLPELAARWEEMPDLERDTWYLEWHELMARLEGLDQVYRAGTMTAEQGAQYRALLGKLKETLPILCRLRLTLPRVVLDVWRSLPRDVAPE
ncbi:MAG: hypothetical protein HY690_12300 [Chloroflexi bacterium]|nr:hypothetical protein [Chloroflexota bacterium]